MFEEQELIHSDLQQVFTVGGKSVEIFIYRFPTTGWTAESVDEHGNSYLWDEEFSTDQDAFDTVMQTIREEGIDALIGQASVQSSLSAVGGWRAADWLDEDERGALEDFLRSDAMIDTAMDFSTLDGFLTAIAMGPHIVPPSEWIPWVWDMVDAHAPPAFTDGQQAQHIMSLIMRHYNSIADAFHHAPESFEPAFWQEDQYGAPAWCEGFLLGLRFAGKEWTLLLKAQPGWLAPFLQLGVPEVRDTIKTSEDEFKVVESIKPVLLMLNDHWRQRERLPTAAGRRAEMMPVTRMTPKVGRNEPCPCGSGRKYKKCCGSGEASTTRH